MDVFSSRTAIGRLLEHVSNAEKLSRTMIGPAALELAYTACGRQGKIQACREVIESAG